jgi:predicted permease
MDFKTTLFNVLIMFFYMIPAYILIKVGKAEPPHAKTVSAILLYISFPCMIFNSFQSIKFDWDILGKVFLFFLISMILLILDIAICFLILKKKYDQPKYRMLTIASALGNVGFLGAPLISGLYPDSPVVVCYSCIYTASMTIMGFTVGVYALTTNKNFMSLYQALYNQGTISIGIAVIIYLAEWIFPKVLGDAVTLLAKMSTPLCMHILGMRLATANILDLFKRPFVYVTSFLKLFIFPLVSYLIVYFLPFLDDEFKASIFILSGAPCAAVILSLAELHNTEQELSANVVLVSTIFCVVTLPILTVILDKTI